MLNFTYFTMERCLKICVSMYVLLCKYILPWINFAPSLVIMSSLFLSTSQQLISRNDPYSCLKRMIPYKPSSPPPWKRYHLMKIYEFWMLNRYCDNLHLNYLFFYQYQNRLLFQGILWYTNRFIFLDFFKAMNHCCKSAIKCWPQLRYVARRLPNMHWLDIR